MTTASGQSIAEARTMALAMFADQVPCFFQLMDPPCEKAARWVVHLGHEENTGACDHDTSMPVCDEHKTTFQRSTHPFWRMWLGTPPIPCDACGTPLRLDRIEAIK